MLPRFKSVAILADLGCHVQKLSLRCSRGFKTSSRYFCAKAEEKAVSGTPYEKLTVGIPKEIFPNERRVAISPAAVQALTKKGWNVNIEEGAGLESKFTNEEFISAGAKIKSREETFKSDIVLKVRPPLEEEVGLFNENGTLISFLYPQQNAELVKKLSERKLTTFAMDKVPRISRAQVFDALSSMANIAGYKGVIEAANNYGRFFSGKCLFVTRTYIFLNLQGTHARQLIFLERYLRLAMQILFNTLAKSKSIILISKKSVGLTIFRNLPW